MVEILSLETPGGKLIDAVEYSEYAKLEAENARLREQITKATDPVYLEEKLRQIGITDDMAAEALSRTGAVKVKALEWRYFDNGDAFAHTHVLSYAAHTNGDWCWRDGPLNKTGGDIETAKAAAQTDFERRLSHHIETAGQEGQQEAVAWQRRQQYSDIPGYIPKWQFVSKEEATGHFERRPGYEYRPLYTRPAEQAVTEAMVEAACLAWINADSSLESSMRAALKAAMEAGRHD